MKFWTDTKEKGEKVKHYIRDLAKKEKPVALSDVMEGFGHIPDPDTYNKIFDNEEILKKMRLREIKSGWFLYLPEPNYCEMKCDLPNNEMTINKEGVSIKIKDTDSLLIQQLIETNKHLFNLCKILARAKDYEEKSTNELVQIMYMALSRLNSTGGPNVVDCVVKGAKSGPKENREDREAFFHKWITVTKGVTQELALVTFHDGHTEQVQPTRIIFKVKEQEEE